MSPTKKDAEDVQETPTLGSEPITVREVWRDVRALNKDVRRMLDILLGDGDEKDGLVPQVKSIVGRTETLEKIVFGGLAVILLAVLVAVIATVIRNPPAVGAGDPPPNAGAVRVGRH